MDIKINNQWKIRIFLVIATGLILTAIGFSAAAWDCRWEGEWVCYPDGCDVDTYECCTQDCTGECWYRDYLEGSRKGDCCASDFEYIDGKKYIDDYECCPGSSPDMPWYGVPGYGNPTCSESRTENWKDCECCNSNSRPCMYYSEGGGEWTLRREKCCPEPNSACAPEYIEDVAGCYITGNGSGHNCAECVDYPSSDTSDFWSESCLSQSKTACCYGTCYDPNPTNEHPNGQQCCGNGCHPLLCDVGQTCCDSNGDGVKDTCCDNGCCTTSADCPTGKVCDTVKGCCRDCINDDDCPPNPNEIVVGGCDTGPNGNQWYFQIEKGVCDTVTSTCIDRSNNLDCGKDEFVEPAKYSCSGWWKKLQQKIKRSCYNESCQALYSYGEGAFTSCNGGIYWVDEEGVGHFIEAEGPCVVNTDKCGGIEHAGAPCYCSGGCSENTIWEDIGDCPKDYEVVPPPAGLRCSGGNVEKQRLYHHCQTNADYTTIDCNKSYYYWAVEDVCGNECNRTGATQCGGAEETILGSCSATVQEEWRCSFCVEGQEKCNIWTEWRVPITGCCQNWGSTSLQCFGNDVWQLKLVGAGVCKVQFPVGPTCSWDFTTTLEMIASCPCGCSGWLATSFPGIAGPGVVCKQTGECSPGTTQSCGNCGTQTCSDTCGWGECQGEGACVSGQTKACACGGVQTCGDNCQWGPCPAHKECEGVECKCVGASGYDSCSSNNDCSAQTQHKECIDQKCLLIPGAGTNLCSQDTECVNQHRECNLQDSCVQVAGTGIDECLTDDNCPSDDPPIFQHNECINRRCVLVPWFGDDLCQNDSDCANQRRVCFGDICIQRAEDGIDQCLCDEDCGEQNSPYIELLRALPETYCIGIPGCGEITFEWKYRDPDRDPESRFDIQVDDNSDFSSPEVDKSFFNLSYPDSTTNTQLIDVKNFQTSPNCGYITFDQSYYVRVRVWDSTGLSSNWRAWTEIDPGVFDWKYQYYDYLDLDGDGNKETFFKDPHPWPAPDFIYLPPDPDTNEEIMFVDLSICYDSNKNPYPCKNINPITSLDFDPNNDYNTYTWIFGDGNSNNEVGDTFHSYTASGIYPVILYICDPSLADPFNLGVGCCLATRNVTVRQTSSGSQAPEWKEISPF